MYLIINSENLIAEIAQHPSYVRRQDNGVIITCDKERADAIYSNDTNTFYPTEKSGYLWESYTFVEVDSVHDDVVAGYYFYHAGEFYTTEEKQAELEKAKAAEQLVEENARLEAELSNTQLALCDIYETLTGGGENG